MIVSRIGQRNIRGPLTFASVFLEQRCRSTSVCVILVQGFCAHGSCINVGNFEQSRIVFPDVVERKFCQSLVSPIYREIKRSNNEFSQAF